MKRKRRAKKRRAVRTALPDLLRKANKRLQRLEEAGLSDKSRGYRNVESLKMLIQKNNDFNIFTDDKLRFRLDVKSLEKTNPEGLKDLEIAVNKFLASPTSSLQEVKKRESVKKKGWDKYQQYLAKNFGKENERLEKANETYNKKIKEYNLYKNPGQSEKNTLTMEEYLRVFEDYIYATMVKYFPSDEAVEITYRISTKQLTLDEVMSYIDQLDDGEKASLYRMEEWLRTGGTPKEKRRKRETR